MLRVELKRILKTRSTWRLPAIALAICLASAFSTVRQVVKYIDHGDEPTEIVRGVGVYEENRERYSVIRGEVTPELFASAVALHHELLARYGTDYDIPPDISNSVLGPYSPVFTWIYYAFSDDFGAALTSADISPERAQNYYQERLDTLERTLNEKYEQTPQVVEYAMSRLSAESGNFYYSYGISSTNAFSSLGLCALLVTLICVVITAPIFSSDYASGADDILHCTRHGRGRLAAAKMGSALLIDLGVFALCFGSFLAVMYFAFGFDDITSGELLKGVLMPEANLRKGTLMSHVAFFELPGYPKLLCLTDGGMCPEPTLAEKEAIVRNAVEFFHGLGYECPNVAGLCGSETVHPKIRETVEAAALQKRAEEGVFGTCRFVGPISYDLAMLPEAGKLKGYHTPLAGQFDILLTPNLVSGNLLGKSYIVNCGAPMAGLILGAKAPIVLTSRGASAEEKYNSLAIAAGAC